jgi:carbamoyl-phosphate synthase small subunit
MVEIRRRKGLLVLASGRVFEGWRFGGEPSDTSVGEVVFNTSLSGYQEILTDPSYYGQIVVMTASHVGNYGVAPDDVESGRIYLSGFVVQEESHLYSNWRAEGSLHSYLAKTGIAGLTGVDTRALTRHLRSQGAVNGFITSDIDNVKALIKKAKALPSMVGRNLASEVSTDKSYAWSKESYSLDSAVADKKKSSSAKKVVVIDFGVKQNILRCLVDRGCEVVVVPSTTPATEILAQRPDGVLFSNGPGDPAVVEEGIGTIRELIDHGLAQQKKGNQPVSLFGICLGHQMMGLALGGKTFKLKFGHHGANHPIKDLETGKVDIVTENHGFCVEGQKTAKGEWIVKGNKDALVTHINLNDNGIEGLRHKTVPLFSVQYHPEASSGPHDSNHLFDRFLKSMEKHA